MGFWSVLYASLGTGSRSLLARGVSPDVLMAELLDRASAYTSEVLVAGGLVLAASTSVIGLRWAGERLRTAQTAAAAGTRADAPPACDEVEQQQQLNAVQD